MAELKPCPFCGSDLIPIGKYFGKLCYEHPDNDCILANVDSFLGGVIIHGDDQEKWNRRAEDGK